MRQVAEDSERTRTRGGEKQEVGQLVPFDRLRRLDLEARRLLALVAATRGVPVLLLLHPSRCTAEVAAARQLAMYLMHVALQRAYIEVGRCFGRDRTTVAYACAHVEDLRDAPVVDAEIAALETALRTDQTGLEGALSSAAR